MPRPEVDLEQFKDQILDLQRSGASSGAILNFCEEKGFKYHKAVIGSRPQGTKS